jgi:hypothetical protein
MCKSIYRAFSIKEEKGVIMQSDASIAVAKRRVKKCHAKGEGEDGYTRKKKTLSLLSLAQNSEEELVSKDPDLIKSYNPNHSTSYTKAFPSP